MGLLTQNKGLSGVMDSIDVSELLKSAARSSLQSALDNPPIKAPAAAAAAKPVGWAAKPVAVVAGGIAGVTAASAAVSAIRRKQKGGESGGDG